MDSVEAEPDSENESFLMRPTTDVTVTEVKHEDLEPPIFCAVKSEPQVRFSCVEYIISHDYHICFLYVLLQDEDGVEPKKSLRLIMSNS
jgi:hypothetical protein